MTETTEIISTNADPSQRMVGCNHASKKSLDRFTWAIQGREPSRLGNHSARVASLPGKCLTGCCFQSHWWYYIPSGLKRRGSPVGASRQPGEVCWSLRGAACTHIHNIHTQMVSMGQHSHHHRSLTPTPMTPTTWSMIMYNQINDSWKMVDALITKHKP